MRIPKALGPVAVSFVLVTGGLLTACETRVVTTSTALVSRIPEVGLQAELEQLSKAEAERRIGSMPLRYKLGAYEESVYPVYWRDDLKNELVILVPAKDGRVQLLKVEVIGVRLYREVEGDRNGRRFSEKGLVPATAK